MYHRSTRLPYVCLYSPSIFPFLLLLTFLAALRLQDAGSAYAATVTTFISDMPKNCTWSDLELDHYIIIIVLETNLDGGSKVQSSPVQRIFIISPFVDQLIK